jgi:hypothetical protein
MLHPLLENMLQNINHFAFLASELPMDGWKNSETAWDEM